MSRKRKKREVVCLISPLDCTALQPAIDHAFGDGAYAHVLAAASISLAAEPNLKATHVGCVGLNGERLHGTSFANINTEGDIELLIDAMNIFAAELASDEKIKDCAHWVTHVHSVEHQTRIRKHMHEAYGIKPDAESASLHSISPSVDPGATRTH